MKDVKCLFALLCLGFMVTAVSAQNKKSDQEMFKEGYVMQSSDNGTLLRVRNM